MKHLILAIALMSSTSLYAVIKEGTYTGSDQNGKSCSFSVRETWTDSGLDIAMNERVELTKMVFFGFKPVLNHFQTSHPVSVNLETGEIGYNLDIFQDTMATYVGAVSATILMNPNGDKSPRGIVYIEDNFKNKAESKRVVCLL